MGPSQGDSRIAGLKFDLERDLLSGTGLSETSRLELESLSLKALRNLAHALAGSITLRKARHLIEPDQPIQARKLGCWLIIEIPILKLPDGLASARLLAMDEDWGTREEVTYLYRRLMVENLPLFADVFVREMELGPSRVRRAIAVGAGRVPTQGVAKQWPGLGPVLLSIVERALRDPTPYLVKNLGPFAIGSYLLGYFPDEIFPAIERWSGSSDAHVRATAARSLTAEGSSADPSRACTLALRLLQDRSSAVSKIAMRAVGRLVKKHPAETRAVVQDWSETSPQRARLAAEWL